MNYKEILIKYITLVQREEGVDFIELNENYFTKLEYEELVELSKEASQTLKK